MKKIVLLLVTASLVAVFPGACDSTNCASSSSTPMVHMCGNHFGQSSITIKQGQSLTLVDDDSMVHVIANGSWVNGSPESKQEPGAPTASSLQFTATIRTPSGRSMPPELSTITAPFIKGCIWR